MIAPTNIDDNSNEQTFRFALVVAESNLLRNSIVEALRSRHWFVHGILRAEQALNILAYIPYRLIVVDSELPGIRGVEFMRTLNNSRDWQAIQLVVITNSQSLDFAPEVAECGAILVRKTNWKHDLFSLLSITMKYQAKSYIDRNQF
ncbi:MAG: response regulator [Verrucomicrobia bacterium]|nr:response regulator [Verrucomicrobiota bacterium]